MGGSATRIVTDVKELDAAAYSCHLTVAALESHLMVSWWTDTTPDDSGSQSTYENRDMMKG